MACIILDPRAIIECRVAVFECRFSGESLSLTSRDQGVAQLVKLVCHGAGVLQNLLLVGLELRLLGLLQGAGQARDGVIVWTSLQTSRSLPGTVLA